MAGTHGNPMTDVIKEEDLEKRLREDLRNGFDTGGVVDKKSIVWFIDKKEFEASRVENKRLNPYIENNRE